MKDHRDLTPLFWAHVLPPYGKVKLNMTSHLTLGASRPTEVTNPRGARIHGRTTPRSSASRPARDTIPTTGADLTRNGGAPAT